MSEQRGYRGSMPAVPLEPLRARDPRDVGEFRLLGRLGGGGMGVAFLAEGQDQWAVVKIIRSELADSTGFQARLRRELEAMSRAAGPRTALVLAQGVEEDPSWFAMEFIPGITLARQVSESGRMQPGQVDAFARELAEILSDIHSAGVVHRDLKPANIMMSPTGPRLIDFGIAAFEGGTQLTATGNVLGTSGWLAPEQVRGDPVGTPTDVHAWALCVLYAALGHPPIDVESSSAAVYRVLEVTPDVPEFVNEPLRALLEAALSKDPARRPTVERILHELRSQQVIDGSSGDQHPPTLAIPRSEQITEEPASVSPAPPPPPPVSASTQPPRRRSRTLLVVGSVGVVVLALVASVGWLWSRSGEEPSAAANVTGEVQEATEMTGEPTVEPSDITEESSEDATPATPESSPTPTVVPIYATTVDYSNERIPDRVFDDTLEWSFDVCVADLDFLRERYLDGVQLREGAGGPRVDVDVTGVQGGRCQASEVNLTFDYVEPEPDESAIGTGWSACKPYRVVLPETGNFARSTIDFCVRTRAEPT